MRVRCCADMLSSKRAVKLRYKRGSQRLKLPEKRSSRNSRERRKGDVLRTITLKTSETSCTCRNLRSRLGTVNARRSKNVRG